MKITILLHGDDPYPRLAPHMIWSLRRAWEESGIKVEVTKGIERELTTDLLFSHLDMSRVPDDYEVYRRQYPCVVNGAVRDVNKRAISQNLVGPEDSYSGPVIVKTNRNYGGLPESVLRQENLARRKLGRTRSAWHRFSEQQARRSLGTTRTLPVSRYSIFPSLDSVPPAVFKNDALVVERFLPEREGDLFCLRVYVFLGDKHLSLRAKGTEPIVKHQSIVSREHVDVPEEILAARKHLGFDYGKFDYVIHQGRVVLLDTNTTPGESPKSIDGSAIPQAEFLAAGIRSLAP